MAYSDAEVRPLLDMEGLKQWITCGNVPSHDAIRVGLLRDARWYGYEKGEVGNANIQVLVHLIRWTSRIVVSVRTASLACRGGEAKINAHWPQGGCLG